MQQATYRRRRQRMMDAMGGGVAILPAAPQAPRNGDVFHPYRQDSDLLYLTGFREPESVAVLRPGAEQPFLLFVPPRDPTKERWNGRRAGVEGALAHFGADAAHPIEELQTRLPDLLKGHAALYYRLGRNPELDGRVQRCLEDLRARNREGVRVPESIVDPGSILSEHRLVKEPEELEVMRRAGRLTAEAHCVAMRASRAGLRESDLQAMIEYVFRRGGSASVAYGSIVAGGANACVLHYVENDAMLTDGDLVLIDAGAELEGYAADITRTFPVNGRFTAPQREVYQLVLSAQHAAIDAARSGRTFASVHDAAVRRLTEGMVALGLLEGEVDALIEKEDYKAYYMHRTSHWLGLDVHDAGAYHEGEGASRVLQPGMVLTIEPGLYIDPDAEGAPERYRGIGVRIEDDVVITEGDAEVLTAGVPKDADEIERLMTEDAELPR